MILIFIWDDTSTKIFGIRNEEISLSKYNLLDVGAKQNFIGYLDSTNFEMISWYMHYNIFIIQGSVTFNSV